MAKTVKTKKKPVSAKKSASLFSQLKQISLRQWLGLTMLVSIAILGVWYGIEQGLKTSASNKLEVMTSFYPVYDLARHVGGDKAVVQNLTPPGAEAHDFEPSPKVLTQAYAADLFIYHDDLMEPWISKFAKDYTGTIVRTIDGIDTNPELNNEEESSHHHEDEHDEDHHHTYDPHVWTDPVLAAKMTDNILAGFIKADPNNRATYENNAAALKAQLKNLDQKFKQQLANCQQRTIVTSHSAYRYFANRYNLSIMPIAGLTPAQEPSAGKLAELSRIVKELGVTTIFFESQSSPHLAQTLAKETGAKTAILDPIEGINQANTEETYVSIQEKNLEAIKAALSCR